MKFAEAIDLYVADQRIAGRINSPRTEVAYRGVLDRHRVDVGNRPPEATGREDCKRTLARWPNPNTQRCSRSILVSFYDWAMEEGYRKDNPARQTRRPKKRPTSVYRLNRDEIAGMLAATVDVWERRAIYLGICGGLRSHELRHLQGLHFDRDGLIWVSADIAKGAKERWVPAIDDLSPIIDDIRATVAPAHFVLQGSYRGGGSFGSGQVHRFYPTRPMSSQTLQRIVHRVAERAGIVAHVHPHLMRHAYATQVAQHSGIEFAQAMLGHADLRTTQGYVGTPSSDQLREAVIGLSFTGGSRTGVPDDANELERRGRDSNPRGAAAHDLKGSPTSGGLA